MKLPKYFFLIIFILGCLGLGYALYEKFNPKQPEPVVPAFDSVAYFRARFDSITTEIQEREHNEFLRQYKADTAIKNQFNEEKRILISAADSLDLVYRKGLLARLDSTKFTY